MDAHTPKEQSSEYTEDTIGKIIDTLRLIVLQEINKEFHGAVIKLEEKEPRWLNATLYEIVFETLNIFKQKMEDPKNPSTSWDNPVAVWALRIPFDLDLESVISGEYKSKKYEIENETIKRLLELQSEELLSANRTFLALQVITAGMILERGMTTGILYQGIGQRLKHVWIFCPTA